MDTAVSLGLAFGFGIGLTFNAALVGAMTRARGGREGALLTPVSAIPVLAVLLVWIAYGEGGTKLPAPFDALAAILSSPPPAAMASTAFRARLLRMR